VQIYVPFEQHYLPRVLVAVRSRTRGSVRNEIRAVLAVAAPSLPIDGEQSAEEYASLGLVIPRVAAYVAGSLGLFGALLAAVGIYGITAYAVSRRTREIGIRTAIGARRMDIMEMILREGVTLGAAGSIIGLVLAAALGQMLTTVLIGVRPIDLVAFGSTALLFASISVAACCVPAYRATRIRAVEALRSE
jgi:putative ABC transport system permease protein